MDVNLISFGKAVKSIRKALDLTQEDVSSLSGVNSQTIRRIENGKVIPKFETLNFLSPIYKQDLSSLFLEYRINDYDYFYHLQNNLEKIFDNDQVSMLHNELRELKIFSKYTKNLFFKDLIAQLILLVKSVISYKENLNYNMALKQLIEAIQLTTPDFSLDQYKSFVYTSIELRILMNIAFVLDKLNRKDEYLRIMEFCMDSSEFCDSLYPILCYNLSGAYYRNQDYSKALKYSNIGIKACQQNRNLNELSLLYYIKGITEYRLDKENYIESLNTSIILCESYGQDYLKSQIIDNCKGFLSIELS